MAKKEQPIYKEINITELKLDKFNPRLPKSLQGGEDQEILNYMLLDASLIELMLAIGVNGFFPGEQLLVVQDPADKKYKVIEGNRRFSAVTLLNNPGLAKVQTTAVSKVIEETNQRPKNIPCLIFDREEGIHTYLGFRHITGIKEWRLLEKARYLFVQRVNNFKNLTIEEAARQIAKSIGSNKSYVRRILVGFTLYKHIEDQQFYKIRDLDDTTFYFNYIADSLNKNNIALFLGIDFTKDDPAASFNAENLKKWTFWLFEKNDQNKTRLLGNSADLGSLNVILGDEKATVAFEKGMTLERARELTGESDIRFQAEILKAIESLEFADTLVVKVRNFYTGWDDDLKTVRTLAGKIKRSIEDIEDEED